MPRIASVLRAALKLDQSEKRQSPDAIAFVGAFGLDTTKGCPLAIDLCQVADALLGSLGDDRSGYDLLIARANEKNLSYITKYIRQKLTDYEARMVDAHLERHPDKVKTFVEAIPSEEKARGARASMRGIGGVAAGAAAAVFLPFGLGMGAAWLGTILGGKAADVIEENAVERSEALGLARQICAEWLKDFTNFVPQPIDDVIRLLERLQARSEAGADGKAEHTGDSTRSSIHSADTCTVAKHRCGTP